LGVNNHHFLEGNTMPLYHIKVTESIQQIAHYYLEADSSDQAKEYVESGDIDIHHIESEPSGCLETLETFVTEVHIDDWNRLTSAGRTT
jgi:hypothetical protein